MMFDDRLKRLREERQLSQREVAEYIGMAQRTYASYENNEREPNSEALVKLANFFDCSTDYLLGLTSIKKNAPEAATSEASSDELTAVNELTKKMIDFLVSSGRLQPGEDLSERDMSILLAFIDTMFG